MTSKAAEEKMQRIKTRIFYTKKYIFMQYLKKKKKYLSLQQIQDIKGTQLTL